MASGSRPASGLALGSRPSSAVSSRWTDDAYEADADVDVDVDVDVDLQLLAAGRPMMLYISLMR